MTDQITELNIDFDALTVAEIDFLEDTLNEHLKELLGGQIVTFADVIAQFRDATPAMKIPQGKVLRALGVLQLRKTNPDATWEDAGALALSAPKAPTLPAPTGDPTPTSGETTS